MSKPMADTNMIAPAPVGESEHEKADPSNNDTVAELPNGYDSSENIKVQWFRGTLCQTLIVGMASFLAPGAYAALAATGAGGLANVSARLLHPIESWTDSVVGRDRQRLGRLGICPDCPFRSRRQ